MSSTRDAPNFDQEPRIAAPTTLHQTATIASEATRHQGVSSANSVTAATAAPDWSERRFTDRWTQWAKRCAEGPQPTQISTSGSSNTKLHSLGGATQLMALYQNCLA